MITHNPRNCRPGYTMVEILVTVAIIAILATLTVAIGMGVRHHAQETQTRATMTALAGAMSDYMRDNPEPTPAQNWVVQLLADPKTSTVISGQKGFDRTTMSVLDAFGSPIQYIRSNTGPKPLPTGFFKSLGRDKIDGTADDLFSNGAAQ